MKKGEGSWLVEVKVFEFKKKKGFLERVVVCVFFLVLKSEEVLRIFGG